VPERSPAICGLLANAERRPAIVYATSRKGAETLAADLAKTLPAAAYHAGLDPETRERVQTAFLAGELEVVVATIAFGMGIDKSNIRTVIHAGLPATLEGYYQEIGRAGRDGKLSRTYLMHSYADQRTHDFFLNRDYPPVDHLNQVFRTLGEQPQAVEELREASRLGEEEFDKALEKLEIHGGARVDFGGNVTVGAAGWKKTYTVQAQFRAEQFEKVLRYTTSTECRMAALVRHFGDLADASRPCGICDVCDPAGAVLRLFRRPDASERHLVQAIADELRPVDYKAAGTLQRSVDPGGRLSRNQFGVLLDAMVRAGLVEIEDAEYEKDGETKHYRKVRLTEYGLELREGSPVELLMSDGVVEEFAGRGAGPSRSRKPKSAATKPGKPTKSAEPVQLTAQGEALAARLREWRTAEAKRLRVPVFMVMHEKTLTALASTRPRNPRQLLEVDGMGPAKVEKFGAAILELCGTGK